MTAKGGGRNNLGTVVELTETGDDCTSPLIIPSIPLSSTVAPTVSAEVSQSSSINLAHASSLTNTVTEDPTAAGTDSIHDVESLAGFPRTVELTSPFAVGASASSNYQHPDRPTRKRLGPIAQTRITFFNFVNSIAGRNSNNRSRNSAPTASNSVSKASTTLTVTAAGPASSQTADHRSRNSDSDIEAGPNSNDSDDDLFEMAPAELSAQRESIASASGETTQSSSITMDVTNKTSKKTRECPLCYIRQPVSHYPKLTNCSHRSCRDCLSSYLNIQIRESRVNVSCPECSEYIHQNDIYAILRNDPQLIEKYESFTVRRNLLNDPDTRWCPAPDCTYAVIANSCAACPQLKCERPGCNTLFCYHCKGIWHANKTCDEARRERTARMSMPSEAISLPNGGFIIPDRESLLKPGDVKPCPRCRTYIVKVDDGSCNHMVCAMCGAEFCWLCLKIITDLHYLSPTGCTFWGKRPWTRKKKLLWQIGTLIGAPVGIALIAGLAVPGIIFGLPILATRKVYQRLAHFTRFRRRFITGCAIVGSFFLSPVVAVMAVGVGVPIMLAYVYGVVPLSLCRNGGCGGGESGSDVPYGEDDEEIVQLTMAYNNIESERSRLLNPDGTSVGVSVHSGLSNEERILRYTGRSCRIHIPEEDASRRRQSVESGVTSLGERGNFDGASVNAMAGSHYDKKSVHTVYSDGQEALFDEGGSTRALAGSVFDAKSLTDSVGRHGVVVFRESKDGSSSAIRSAKLPLAHSSAYPPSVPSEDSHPLESSSDVAVASTSVKQTTSNDHESLEGSSAAVYSSRLSGSLDVDDGQVDPYKVHAFMDNIKQILSDEAADEPSRSTVKRPFKKNSLAHASSSTVSKQHRQGTITRTSSSKSGGTTVSAQVSEEGAHVVITSTTAPLALDDDHRSRTSSIPSVLPRETTPPSQRRSFFSRIFRRNKPSA